MVRAWTCPARLCALVAALALVTISFGIASPASAETPEADRGNSEVAHENNADRKEESAATTTTTTNATATGGDVVASDRGGGSAKATTHAKVGTSGTSGVATEEQPVSNADQNTGGANGQCSDTEPDVGVYCSTRDGSPSGNGQGVGEATGKPCAGCVGKADNKNPPGQMPNASEDGNNGYECDDNNGVGHGKVDSKDGATSAGNPAHTGCTTPPTIVDECPPGSTAPECVEDEVCPPGSQLPECVEDGSTPPGENPPGPEGNPNPPSEEGNPNPSTIAGEQDFGAPRPPTVAGVQQFAGPPAAAAAAAPHAGVLPSTGATSTSRWLTMLGVGLLLMGAALIGLRRHSPVTASR